MLAAVERATGIGSRYSVPAILGMAGLLLGGLGESLDIAYHVDFGRDDNLLTAPHTMILLGIGAIALAGLLALILPGQSSPGSLRVGRRRLPAGGLVVLACSALALAAFPLDGVWHELFGEDLTLWSPTHLLLIGGPMLSILGLLLLLRQGGRLGEPTRLARAIEILLAGLFLIALTDLQSEFTFGVPQFRLLYHPITVAVAGALGLVLARGLLGRGGALKALLVLYALSAVPLAIGLLDPERTLDRAPLYLVEALVVELAAGRARRLSLAAGALAGLGVGTLGLAAEWAWSRLWMPYPWGESLLPEAALLAPLAAVAAGILGARIARAFGGGREAPAEAAPPVRQAALTAGALLVLVVVLAIPLPREASSARATVVPFETTTDSTAIRVSLDPPAAAADAEWFRIAVFHGGTTEQIDLRETAPGRYVGERRVPLGPERDAVLRLARGASLASIPIYSAGAEHGEEPQPLARRSQRFETEHVLPPVTGSTERLQQAGYGVVAVIAAFWLFWIWRALAVAEGRPLLPSLGAPPPTSG